MRTAAEGYCDHIDIGSNDDDDDDYNDVDVDDDDDVMLGEERVRMELQDSEREV